MLFGSFRKPYKSIFDIFHTLKYYNRILAIACFTSVQRDDGVEIHFADTGDQTYSAALSAISSTAFCMLFFCNYFPNDSTFDDVIYKAFSCFIAWYGSVCRLILSLRIDTFLKALSLIQEVDEKFKRKGIPVNHEASRAMAKKSALISMIVIPSALFFLYSDVNISDDVRIYHFINFSLGSALSVATGLMECVYFLVIVMTLERRFEDLTLYLGKLKKFKNSKIMIQELQMISTIHMKLCQSWSCASESLGAAAIGQYGMLYIYLFYPLVYFDYVLSRAKKEMAPVLIVMFYVTYLILNTFTGLKSSATNLKKAVIEFNLEIGKSQPVIRKMGIKGCSVFMMFFLQVNNSNMF